MQICPRRANERQKENCFQEQIDFIITSWFDYSKLKLENNLKHSSSLKALG